MHFSPGDLGVNRACIPKDLVYAQVSMRVCAQMDGVHPSARECETDCATVQGHSDHSAVCVFYCSSLAIVTGSSTLPQSVIAVAYMDANNAVDLIDPLVIPACL